ncbi:MAG: alkylhydroperoxidase [Paenibacillus sp.]|nr:alkylhydroperoxidase [Paenibacillus sp.]
MSNLLEIGRSLYRVPELAPHQQQAYQHFSQTIWREGVLSSREKETIAVAVAHSTKCHYCIDHHTKKAKRAGATLKELAEAIMVTAAIEGQGCITHAVNALAAYEETGEKSIYQYSNLDKLEEVRKIVSPQYEAANNFFAAAFQSGELTSKLKTIIAVAVAHTTESPYLIQQFTESAKKEGASKEEILESIFIASLMRAGGTITYISDLINAYEN